MAEADFDTDGVNLRLTKEEWWFVTSALSYVLHGHGLPDNDFRTILMMDGAEAERFKTTLDEAEMRARRSGDHWNLDPSA